MTDLQQMLATLEPKLRDGEYVYVTDPGGSETALEPDAVIQEDEGRTIVVRRGAAVEAVGLTAAFSTALTEADISCNVLAGLRHDHILVPVARREDALAVLRALASRQR